MWIFADVDTKVWTNGGKFTLNKNEWTRCVSTFTAVSDNCSIVFGAPGTYYIYHPQLELGNHATDWSPNPDDMASNDDMNKAVDDAKKEINESIAEVSLLVDRIKGTIESLVSGENGETQLVQTENGWTFNIKSVNEAMEQLSNDLGDLNDATGDTNKTVSELNESVNKLQETSSYVRIVEYTYENDAGETITEPCIELGKEANEYRVLITNTSIMFRQGIDAPTKIDTSGLVTQNITVQSEIRHTSDEHRGYWIWKARYNGNYGLQCKAVID
jgi:uncharacterized protein YukE